MRNTLAFLLLVPLPILTFSLSAQEQESVEPATRVETSTPRNQIALDGGSLLAFSLSYARRVKDTDFSVGGGLGFAWELNMHTFGRAHVWSVVHLEGFVRYQVLQALMVDLGVTAMKYYWADDCSDCTGTFLGLHSAAMVGYRFVFIGVNARLGWKSDERHGSEFGVILSPQVRIVIPWG